MISTKMSCEFDDQNSKFLCQFFLGDLQQWEKKHGEIENKTTKENSNW
jgi:hypothetical protein